MSIGKDNGSAFDLWGNVYDRVPKSVFAIACWYLADICSDKGVGHGDEFNRFRQEIEALEGNGIISKAQARRVLAALPKPEES